MEHHNIENIFEEMIDNIKYIKLISRFSKMSKIKQK